MFPKGANMSKLLKQAQKMKQDMEEAQNSLEDMRIDYKSSNQMIDIVMNSDIGQEFRNVRNVKRDFK